MPFLKKGLCLWILTILVSASILPLVLMPSKALASTNFDLATTTNYNLRFDGAAASDWLGVNGAISADLNNNGRGDLIIVASGADNNSRDTSGSVYIIYDSLLDDYTGTGNNVDLNTSTNYNLRYDGAAAGDMNGTGGVMGTMARVADLNNNGKQDLIISANYADNNSRSNSGSLYIIYDSLIDDYSGTGNNIDLNTATNYNLRYDGAAASDFLSYYGSFAIADLDNNGKGDLLVGAEGADNNSRSASGSLYIIYDSLIDDYSGTGNNIDLNTATNYNLRYDGGSATEQLTMSSLTTGDLDTDGKLDILVGAYYGYNSRAYSGSLYVIYNTLIDDYTSTGNNIDLNTSTNYNLRYDGAAASDFFAVYASIATADLDNDGKQDIVAGAIGADNNSRSLSGSLYVIYNTLIDDYTGTGNNIDMNTAANYNLRYDGAAASTQFGTSTITIDFFGTGKKDILVGANRADNNSRTDSGSAWVIANTLIDDYSGTGNNIDLNTAANSTLRYDGAVADDRVILGPSGVSGGITDIDNDGSLDLVIAAYAGDFNSRSNSGSVYIIYNFPHAFSLNPLGGLNQASVNIKGTLSASNSTTNISDIQYSNGTSYSGTWTSCTADDGSFNLTSENFTCSLGTLIEGGHTFWIRAYDTNNSYTWLQTYGKGIFAVDTSLPQGTFTTKNGDKINFSLVTPKDQDYVEDNLPEFTFIKAKDNVSGINKYQIILTNTQTKETDSNHMDNYVYIDNIDPNSPAGVDNDGKAIENSSGANNGESSRTRDQVDKKIIYSGFSIKVKGKRDNDKLKKGTYKWKVRALDYAGNRIDSEERILNIGISKVTGDSGQVTVKNTSTNTKQIKGTNTKLEAGSLKLEASPLNTIPTPVPTPTPTFTPNQNPSPNPSPSPFNIPNIFNFLELLKKILPF